MKWSAKIGAFTTKRCCFCEYWVGPRPVIVQNSTGAYIYESSDKGMCRHPLFRSKTMTAGATCGKFEQYMHLH